MKEIIKIENNLSKILRIEWNIGNTCNYKCHYCFPGANNGTIPFPVDSQIEILKENLKFLFDYYLKNSQIEKIQLYYTGGEPTLWKNLIEISKYLKEIYDEKLMIQVLTNGYRKLEWWAENCHIFDHIEFSIHHEYTNIDHIISVCDYLFSHQNMVVTNILMDPYNFEKCRSITEKMLTQSSYNWPVIVKPVRFGNQVLYDPEQLDYLRTPKKRIPHLKDIDHFFKIPLTVTTVIFDDGEKFKVPNDGWFILHDRNHFNGWKCNLGVELLKISFEGNLAGNCEQKLFDKTDYFNILDINFTKIFRPIIKPVICKQDTCLCTSEVRINKEKIF